MEYSCVPQCLPSIQDPPILFLALIFERAMSKMSVLLILIGLTSPALARINLHDGPLFSGATSFTLELETRTLTKPTPCFVTSGDVSQCRRKRGIEESPKIMSHHSEMAPSPVVGIEATPVARVSRMGLGSFHRYNSNQRVFSSFDDASYSTAGNNYRQPVVTRGRNNVISVGDCGMSTVNFSEFLSCLGLDVQQTTTLTATFTETSILSTGYTTMTVLGCTPAGFPYPSCSAEVFNEEGEFNDSTTEFNDDNVSTPVF